MNNSIFKASINGRPVRLITYSCLTTSRSAFLRFNNKHYMTTLDTDEDLVIWAMNLIENISGNIPNFESD
jgi:hypothetical protein